MVRRPRLVAVVCAFAVAGLVASCGEDAASSGSAGVGGLQSAWLAQPFALDTDVAQAAVRTCRASSSGSIPQTSTAQLVDARGGGRLVVVFSGPREQVFVCLLVVSDDGSLDWSSGWGGDRHSAEGPLLAGEIRPEAPQAAGPTAASGPPAAITTATGRVGRSVAGVDLLLASGLRVRATTIAGWYAAWWPTDDAVTGYQAINGSGQPLGPVQH